METPSTEEMREIVSTKDPIAETPTYAVFDIGSCGEIDGEPYRLFAEIAKEEGVEYFRAFTADDEQAEGAFQSFTLNLKTDSQGYVICDKSLLRMHAMIAPNLVGMGLSEHLQLVVSFAEEAGVEGDERAKAFRNLLKELDEDPVTGTEADFA